MITINDLESFEYQIALDSSTDEEWDVIIVGAGPAGAYAGIKLAAHGLRVLLIDSANFPRDKACGDGLIADAINCFSKIDLLEDVRELGYQSDKIEVFSPSGHSVDIAGEFIGLKRRYLDALIAKKAISEGCSFAKGLVTNVISIDNGRSEVQIKNSQKPLRARVVLIATGAGVSIPWKLGIVKEKKPSGLAVRCYIKSRHRIDHLIISYEKSILPGYAWIFPLGNNEYNVGCGTFYTSLKNDTQKLKHTFQRFIENFPLASELVKKSDSVSGLKGCPLRCGLTGSEFTVGEKIIGIGESIGTTFPFTGEGIGKAMETAEIAADLACEALAKNDLSIIRRYRETIQSELEPRYIGYRMAEKLCKNRFVLDRATKYAQKNERMRKALAGVLNETVDLRSFTTVSAALKALKKSGS